MKVYMNLLISFYLLFFSSMAIAVDEDIFSAALSGIISKLRSFISAGEDVNARDEYGNTPLHRATSRGNLEAVRFLLKQGADVNARDRFGDSPLHIAAMLRNLEAVKIVKILLEQGADVNARNRYRRTALHIAERNSGEMVEVLKEAGKEAKRSKCESIFR